MAVIKHEISAGNLTIDREVVLGHGGAGNVYRGTVRYASGNRTVAVKELDQVSPDGPPYEYTMLRKASEQSPFVAKPIGFCVKNKKTCIVLKLYEKSLAAYLLEQKGGKLALADVVRMGKQLAEAVRILHKDARIGHFDIKPDNVLLDEKLACHLCDFSIALDFPAGQTNVSLPQDGYGSPHYMAPEQVTNLFNGLTQRADTWGLAATLLHMATGVQPFADLDQTQRVHNALRSGAAPSVPSDTDGRFASILRAAFRHNPADRFDASTVRAQLSQLNEELRMEGGGVPTAPPEVLAAAYGDGAATAPGTSEDAPLPEGGTPAERAPKRKKAGKEAGVPAQGGAAAVADGGAEAGEAAEPPAQPGTPAATEDAAGADFLGVAALSLADAVPMPAAPARPSQEGARAATSPPQQQQQQQQPQQQPILTSLPPPPGAGAGPPPAAQPRDAAAAPGAEAVVLTACSDGSLGVKTLFRSHARLIAHPSDRKQMTGVAVVPPDASAAGACEAVSVSAAGTLSMWDVCEGRCLVATALEGTKLPAGAVGRSVAANDRFVALGTDRSRVALWQFPEGGASWKRYNGGRAAADQAAPQCVAVSFLEGEASSRIFDLSLQPPYEQDAGGRWLVGCSQHGHIALWDAERLAPIVCQKAASGAIFSCSVMPGSNMVALACTAPQLVQVWDCRDVPSHVSAVMSCDLPHRANGGDAKPDRVCSITTVPAPGALPSQLLLGTESGKVCMWDLRRQGALWTVAQLPERVLGVAASRDGSRVVMGTQHGQVAMLDWSRPLSGQQGAQAQAPYVTHWTSYNPMFVWPSLERGVLRMTCADIVSGPFLQAA